jgi:hypothetical protein
MPKLNQKQTRGLIYRYFLNDGWLPAGTTVHNWTDVTMGDMEFDDPALPSDPHIQKKRVSLDLQSLFQVLGSSINSPLAELKKKTLTLGDFAAACWASQED